MKRKLILGLLICLGQSLLAQLSTNNSQSGNSLVRNVLAGEGIEISNVTYSGSNLALGEFFGSSSNIGLDHGIIMSTGTVLDEVRNGKQNGPVGPNNNSAAQTSLGTDGDPEIGAIVGFNTFDAAILEFDFIPQGDTVAFRYVFASEEYPNHVGGNYNDFFAFFISGPGISGTQNIALLPGTSTPVSINNVNAGFNNAYYINNGNGLSGSQVTNSSVVNYNGFTTVLTAISQVTPCQTYHLKISITDVSDRFFDSAVFLEGNSLQSVPTFALAQSANKAPTGSNEDLFEDCTLGEVEFTRENKLHVPLSIGYALYGTAELGVDYTLSSTQVDFAVGDAAETLTITPLQDGQAESDETVILRFPNPQVCDAQDSVDITYIIKDQTALVSTTENYDVECADDPIVVSTNFSGGVPSYNFAWSTGENTEDITASLNSTGAIPYTITDECGQTITDSVIINVPVYPPLVSNSLADTVMICRGAEVTREAQVGGGAGSFSFLWSDGQTTQTSTFQILVTETISVTVTDKCGSSIQEDFEATLNYPAFSVQSNEDSTICFGDTIQLSQSAAGGFPPYTYNWIEQDESSLELIAISDSVLYLEAYDSCGIVPAIDTVNFTIQQPTAGFTINASLPEPFEEILMQNTSENASYYSWDFGNGLISSLEEPTTTYNAVDEYQIQLIAIDQLGCTDTIMDTLQLQHPLYFYVPNAFSPNGDGVNDLFQVVGIGITDFELTIFDRGGGKMFQTTSLRDYWDGTTNGRTVPAGFYVIKYKATSSYRDDKEFIGAKSLMLVR